MEGKEIVNTGKRIITIVLTAMMIITAMPVIPGEAAGRVYAAGPVGSLNGKQYTSFEKLTKDLNSNYKNKKVTIEMLSAWNAAGSDDFDRELRIPWGCEATLNMHGNVWNRNRAFRGSSKGDGELLIMEDYSTLVINGASNDEEKNKGPYPHVMEYSSSSSGAKANKDTTSSGATMTGGCSSDGGGAITEKNNCTLTINDVSIVGCGTTNGTGGGIYVKGDYTDLRLNYVTIRGCYSDSHGGGIYLNDEPSTLEMNGSVIKNNYANDDGGGIYTNDETMTITGRNGSMITGNEAGRNGGGVYDYAGEISLSGFEISNNTAKRNGGGVFLDDTKSTVSACTIKENSATGSGDYGNGGGVYVEDNNNKISSCDITGNKANRSGGGVYVYKNVREEFSISGVTVINDNKANWPGNQLYVSDSVPSDTRINFSLAKGSNVAVCYDPDALAGKNSVMVTQGSVGDTIKSPNCIRYLHPSNEGWHFTFNSAPNQRKIYYVRDGKDSSSTGEPDEDTQQDPVDVTPLQAINNPDDQSRDTKAGIVGKVGKGGGNGSEYNLIRGFSRHQETDGATADTATVFYYSDAFFDDNPRNYNTHLATASLNMAYAGMYLHAEEAADASGNIYYNRHAAARQFLADIGCPDQNIYVNDSNEIKPGTDSIGVTIGSKNLAKADGTETGYILIPIVTRGGGYESEWASNFTLDYARFTGDRGRESKGFSQAADQVMESIEAYINKYGLTEAIQQGKVKFWIAGYSRGGATANITAKRLVEKYADGTSGQNNQVFAYTCEAPMGGTDTAEQLSDGRKYYCIHNMQNGSDIVPLVAPQLMGFKRYGVDHYIPGDAAGTVRSEKALTDKRSGTDGPTTATTYRDNEIGLIKQLSNEKKNAMLRQLRAVDSGIILDDYFHPMKMGLLPPSIEENGHYDHNHVEMFIRDFMRFAQEGMNPTETDRRTQAIPSRDYYADYLQDGLRAIIGSVMVMDSEATEGLIGRIGSIMSQFLFLDKLDGANLIMYIQKWGELSPSEKAYWESDLWRRVYNTGAFDFLSEDEKATFGWYWSDVIDLALTLVYADYKYNPEKYHYSDAWAGGTDGTNVFVGTFASYYSFILANHLPEVNLAWARSYDSFYDNETTEYETLYQDRAAAAGYSVKAPSALGKETVTTTEGDKEKTEEKDKKLEEGESKTNRLSGDQKIILENEDIVGEAVYYDLVDNTDKSSPVQMETNLLYRGGVDLTLGTEFSKSYTMTTYDISYGVRSRKAVYNIRLVNDKHKVTVDNGSGEIPDKNPKDYLYKENDKVTVTAEPADEKYFKHWKVELLDDKGNTAAEDITDKLLADQKTRMTASFTMPSAGSDKYDDTNVYPEGYALKVTAVCADKIKHIDADFTEPVAGQPLAVSAELGFDNGKNGTYPISWTYTTGTGKDSKTSPATGDARNNTVYTAAIIVPQDVAQEIIFASSLTGEYKTSADGTVKSVTRNDADGSATIVIEFKKTSGSDEYTITWLDDDGTTVLGTKTVAAGDPMPQYDGTPVKAATEEFTYTFDKWIADAEPVGDTVTRDVTFTASYTATKKKYAITFKNGDEVLQSGEVEYGRIPAYNGDTPVKQGDEQNSYVFAGWEPAVSPVTDDQTYQAVFVPIKNSYTIRWLDDDGTTLYEDLYDAGDPMPQYDGTPVKAATEEFTFDFDDWIADGPVGPIVERDVTFTASYTATKRMYTIIFNNYDGTELQNSDVEYGQIPAYTGAAPVRPDADGKTYTFAGWDPAVSAVTGNKTYTATFTAESIPVEPEIKLTVRAYDLNINAYDSETKDTVLQVSQNSVIMLKAPEVNSERFVKWDFKDTKISLEEGYGPADKVVKVKIPAGLTTDELAIDAQYIPVINEISVEVDAPAIGKAMQTDAEDGTMKVKISHLYEIDPDFVKITWAPAPLDKDGAKMPDYKTVYTATVSIAPKKDGKGEYVMARRSGEEKYQRTSAVFYYSEDLITTFNGESVTCDTKNNSVSFTFPETDSRMYKLVYVEQPNDISGAEYGTGKDQVKKMLPDTVKITLDDGSVIDAEVNWADPSAASKQDDREETFWTANGKVKLPDDVENPNDVSLEVVMHVSVLGADTCIAPESTLPDALYTLDQVAKLKTLQSGGVTYYTLDGSDPSDPKNSNRKLYDNPDYEIQINRDDAVMDEIVIDEDGNVVPTGRKYIELKAVTTKENMWDSAVATYRYVFEPITPALTYVEVKKDWSDGDDQDGIRPDSVTVKLLSAAGSEAPTEVRDEDGNAVTLELSEDNNWEGLFAALPEKNDDGQVISYSVDEQTTDVIKGKNDSDDGPGTYKYSVEGVVDEEGTAIENAFTITNTHTPEIIDISGKIDWVDNNNQDGVRPNEVTIRLFAGKDEVGAGMAVTASDNWAFTFEKMPKYANGKAIEYSITEDNIDDYTSSISGDAAGGFTVTNKHTPGKTQVNVQKVWFDDFDRDGIRPDSVTVKLFMAESHDAEDREAVKDSEGKPVTLVLSEENGWTGSFTGLDAKKDGKDIYYSIDEEKTDVITGEDGEGTYKIEPIIGTMKRGYKIWNIHTPKAIDISGIKVWDDKDDQDGTHPDQITIRLKADNKEVESIVVTEDDAEDGVWKWSFKDLPVNQDGKKITYTVSEDSVTDYTTEIGGDAEGGFTVTNKYEPGKTQVSVSKVWEDEDDIEELRPDYVTVKLLSAAEGEEPAEATDKKGRPITMKLSDNNDWTDSFRNLDTKKDGKTILYSVQEEKTDVITGKDGKGTYTDTISGSADKGFTITNTHTVERIRIKGKTVWDDNDNANGTRPDKITVHLMNGSTVVSTRTVNANEDWQWSFDDVQKYHKGEEIKYSIQEDNVKGYTTAIDGFTVINKLIPDKPDDPAPADPDKPDDPAPADTDKPDDPAPADTDKPDDPTPADSDKPDDPTPDVTTHTITYDLNGGSYNGSTKAITEEYPEGTIIKIHVAPVREGYTFKYWKGSKYQPGDSYTVTENHTFTAQWKKASDKEGFSGDTRRGPKTGDSVCVLGWTVLFMASLLAMIIAVLIKRRQRG